MAGWNPITQPIDYVLISGKKSPGIAEVVGADAPRKYDKLNGYGFTGSVLRYRGLDLSAFSIKVRLYNVADWDAWNIWREAVSKPPTKALPQAQDIWHPFTEALEIKQIAVLNVKQPVQEDDGVWMHEIEVSDYRRLKLALQKVDGSDSGKKVLDPYDQIIEQQSAQIAALGEELDR